MKSIIVFSSILIATLAIQCAKCSAVQVVDSFFPSINQPSNSRGTSQRSHSARLSSGVKNTDKKIETVGKIETIGFVEQQANQLNPSNYMNAGGVQQSTTFQDGSIKQGNDGLAYYYTSNRNNQRQRYPSHSNKYRSSQQTRMPSQGMTGATTYGSHPMNNMMNPYANGIQTLVPLTSMTHQQIVPTTGHIYVSSPSNAVPVMTSQFPSGLMQNNGLNQNSGMGMGQQINLVQSHQPVSTYIRVPATVVHTPVYTTYAQQHIVAH